MFELDFHPLLKLLGFPNKSFSQISKKYFNFQVFCLIRSTKNPYVNYHGLLGKLRYLQKLCTFRRFQNDLRVRRIEVAVLANLEPEAVQPDRSNADFIVKAVRGIRQI